MAVERVWKSWGYEEILHNGEYCCKKLVYTKHIASSMHYHDTKHETFVVGAGSFIIETAKELRERTKQSRLAVSGSFVILPPGMTHRIRCVELGFLVEASTPDDPLDCVRLEASET